MTTPVGVYDSYVSPLAARNASPQMLRLWSPRYKFTLWRRIWLAVAQAQHELGLPVTAEQVRALGQVVMRPGGITDEEIRVAEAHERALRHDVMAHVHALGESCPQARGIIHLGMTSQDVVCNADTLTIRAALRVIELKVVRVQLALGEAATRWKHVPTLGFTHYQPAQPVTVGRRCALWANDLCDLPSAAWPKFRGLRGATGTQASFLALCGGDARAVERLELLVMFKLVNGLDDPGLLDQDEAQFRRELTAVGPSGRGDDEGVAASLRMMTHALVGQTYPRVDDAITLAGLAATASVLHKIATDIRLLCNRKELDEPFEDKQIGSSAMPYKRNPMRCERICGLSRFVMNLVGNAYDTAATQWLERTLDDSSNRRLSLAESFLALDGALDLMHNVASGLIVHEAMVRKNLMAELPFMATENILMACVKLGGDRQEYHEHIRAHAQAAGMRVKSQGLDNDLLDRLKADRYFWSTARGGPLSAELDWAGVMDPMTYIGRSIEQTERFIRDVVEPLRGRYADELAGLEASAPKV
jgi:adenylosuccinate lyase